ncbi:MAG: dimethylarginine dimethylaminohydrolase family protein [Candidatus Hodarchaeales archaeon]|jgi:dimethylargininase
MKKALVREPAKSFPQCISSHPSHNSVSYNRAISQHRIYVQTLRDLGLDVIELPPLKSFPDSCFVEDTAVIHNGRALVSNMGTESRRGEEESVRKILREYFKVEKVFPPATVEGGDVIHFPDYIISGVTQRTNNGGIQMLRNFLQTDVKTIIDRDITHLKSYVTYLDQNNIIMNKRYSESYASNTLTYNGTVLIPTNFPSVIELLEELDYDVISLEMSEFEKCEGALTCLSLLF